MTAVKNLARRPRDPPVKMLLGRASIATTERYTAADDREIRLRYQNSLSALPFQILTTASVSARIARYATSALS
jgi:hypothetical protein